eukprot:TRINITY_DN26100_c0_g1_i1.p1 TRINITY_DN26100_c0_g1~~TRINITY_DN26100_c0_g1_i1.p1  ORF type:complete len:454 (+),score=100.61 TRINITY_DN26100_c0_g1_i1:115-1476(+)
MGTAAEPPVPTPPRDEAQWDASGTPELDGIPSCKDDKLSYRRLRLLGQGSFGKAFLARDLSDNELCVMKQIRVEKMDTKARDTAVREAVALRRVRHPNVVRFRQVFVRSGWLCLVMDFADGGDLCAAVKERARSKCPFEESAVLECFAQVADAVNYVHSLKMVHRDIKSRNIFLCRTGRALLGDFGLVRMLEATCELAHTRVGTPYYLSPEIVRKQPYNYKTDVWSLGVLLYEMAALTRPFVGTLETLPKIILKGIYQPLAENFSEGLKALVAGMLQVDPESRLELGVALKSETLQPPLQRARDALGLDAPEPEAPRSKRADRMRSEVNQGAEQMKSDWIGYNTMIRGKAEGPIIPKALPGSEAACEAANAAEANASRPAEQLGAEDGAPNASVGCSPAVESAAAAAATATGGAENWSTKVQPNADSGEEDLGSISSDSWGSVVDSPELLKES